MIGTLGSLFNFGIADISDGVGSATNFIFFQKINDFLRTEIDYMQWRLLSSAAALIGSVAVVVLTVWIMWQGFRIVTGQSRQPMMVLVGDAAKATLVVFVATSIAYASSPIYWTLTDGMTTTIARYVTATQKSPFQSIDDNLAKMEAAMAVIDSVDTGNKEAEQSAKDRNRWFTGIGVAGPSVVAGAMLLLNKIALALFIGFGPFFIMCLLFESTKQLFQKWLLYGIGTVFSLAVLSVMVSIAMKMLGAITTAYAAKYLTTMALTGGTQTGADGINSLAIQQGGIGLLLSTLIVMAPPMAASFFQGTLGQFSSYSSFGLIGSQLGAQDQQAIAQGKAAAANAINNPPPSNRGAASEHDIGASRLPGFGANNATSGYASVDQSMKNMSPNKSGEA